MTRLEVKRIVRRCVSRWAGQKAHQSHKLASLRGVTVASRRLLAREINGHPDLAPCASVVRDNQIRGSMTVSQLGTRVWNNKPGCLAQQP